MNLYMNPVSIECPSSHKYVMNGGLTCCSIITQKDFPYLQIEYYDPKDKCEDWVDCPDQSRTCRASGELPGQFY